MDWFAWIIEFYSKWLSPVQGFILGVPVFWTWGVVVFGRKRRYQKWHAANVADVGSRPVIFGVDALPGKDMKASVQHFCQDDEKLSTIPESRRFWITRKKNLTPDNIFEFRESLRTKLNEIAGTGVNTIHLFYAGPVAGTAIVGAELANFCRVLLYQHDRGHYINMGPLEARGALEA